MRGIGLLLLSCGSVAALAATEQPTLNVAFSRETDYVDRLHTDSSESAALSLAIYDTLLYRDPVSAQLKGLLAERWTWNSARTVVEFELRRGVTFQDGERFDADDVIYTIGLAIDPNSRFRQQDASFGFIKHAERTGEYTVRVELHYASALAEEIFASRLVIWPAEYGARDGGHNVQRTAPVGTGPYRVQHIIPGREISLVANPTYFDGPKPRPSFEHLRVRIIPDAQTRIAELLSGTIDFAWDLPTDQVRFLAQDSRFKVSYATGARITFLSLDAAGRSGSSPLQNKDVRIAIAQAIDRAAIAEHLAGPTSRVIRNQCHPQQRNCPREHAEDALEFNPAAARKRLDRAGFGETGLSLELLVGSNRLRQIAEALQWQLRQVGIDVRVRQFTLPAWRRKFMQGESQSSLVSFGGDLLDVAATLPGFFDGGGADYARDAQLTHLIASGLRQVDERKRGEAFERALQRAAQEVYTVPLHTLAVNFVYRRDLCYEPGALPLPDLLRIAPCAIPVP